MACEVTVKDIQNLIRNRVKDRFDSVKFTKYSDRLAGFIPYDASNPSKNVLYGKVKNLESQLNKEFNASKHGAVVSFRQTVDGVEFNIHPSRKLADEMYMQNIYDEEQSYNSRYSNRQEDESIPNNQQPIGDNYVEFVRYKKAQLEDIEKKINYLKSKLKNQDNIVNRNKLKEYYNLQQSINNQLEILSTNQIDYMFHAVIEDLQAIKYALDSNQYHNVTEVSDKLNWYKDFIPNLDLSEHEDFNYISGLLNSIVKTYNDKMREKALKQLEDEEQTQFLLKVQNEGKLEDEKITVEDLVKVSKDIDWLDLTFFGLKSDTTDNTIIPQFLLHKHNQIIKKRQADMLELHDRLDAVIKRNKMTDFDWVFSKDSKGNKDGFLIDLFSEKWYAADNVRKQKLSQYKNSLFDANIDTKITYTNVINWYKENTIVIDFTRLNVVKEKYGSLYPEYFTYDDTSISAYEENIKKQLGPRYEDTISKILDKLQKFEELKTNDESEFKERNIASHNVWEFLKSYKNGFPGQIEYTYGDNKIGKVYFNPIALSDLQFLPESKITKIITTDIQRRPEKIDTGFYSKEFQNILSDSNKVEYWTVLKDMSEFIKNSYQLSSSGRLEYPKINKRLSERAIENLKSLQTNRKAFGIIGKTFKSYLHEYKSLFYGDSKDKNYEENKVVSTYIDSSSKEIKDKVRVLMLKSGGKLKYKEALEQARAEVLPNYSSDINTLFKAMTAEAAMHEARVEMQPIAQSMIEYFKTITIPDGSKDDKVRKNAVNKLETYYKSIILNQNLDNTNTIVGKPNKHLKKLKITKLYSDAEKSLMKDLGVILEEGLQDNLKLKSNESVLEETVKNDNGTTTISIINNSTGKIRKETLDNKGNLFKMEDSVEGKNYVFQAIINDGEILYNSSGKIVDFETFNQEIKNYIQDKINSLGQDTTLAGITDGILKTIIWNSLAFSPVSGIFNRIEGKHSAMLMDLTGEYWTPGNIDIANQMMAFSNIKKIALERLPKDMQGAKQQVEIFDLLVKKLDVLQDRKNELQKNVSKTSWSNIINPFKWSVDNPEFKNQGAIMLAILMDTKINGIPLLNKETGKFEAFHIQDGVLKLKPEFEGLIDFGSEEFSTLTSKMVDAISHSQGDYDINDIKKYKTNLAGRSSTLFLTWMPEHINQRWGVVGDNSYNYFTGKKKRNGRYITAAKANPVNFVSYWLMTGAITYGSLGLVATAGVGVLGAYILASRLKVLSKNTGRDINYIREFIGLLQHIVAESLNYPSRMLNLKKGRIGNSVFLAGDLLQGNNLTPEEIGAIQSMARELAFMLNSLLIKFAIAALMYDDDDDRESQKRQYYNFMQNQLSRSITSLSVFTNPDAFMKDNTKVAFLSQLANVSQLIAYGFNGKEDETNEILGTTARIFGMPNTINRALFEGTMPWESKTNYDELSFEYAKSIKPLSWFPKYVKDKATDEEYSSKKDYEQIRKDLREELRSEYMDKVNGNADALEKVVNIIIERKIGHKNKGVSYKETLEDLQDGSISNKKKSNRSLKKQKETLKETLEEADLSNSEIGDIMREVYATKRDSN